MNQNVTIEVDQLIKEKIIEKFTPFKQENNGEYIEFFAKSNDLCVLFSILKELIYLKFILMVRMP